MEKARHKYVTVEVMTTPSREHSDGVSHRHYRLYYGDRKRNMLANGMDGIWVRREKGRVIDVKMSDAKRKAGGCRKSHRRSRPQVSQGADWRPSVPRLRFGLHRLGLANRCPVPEGYHPDFTSWQHHPVGYPQNSRHDPTPANLAVARRPQHSSIRESSIAFIRLELFSYINLVKLLFSSIYGSRVELSRKKIFSRKLFCY